MYYAQSLQYNQFCLAYATISLAGEKKKPKAQKALLECFVQPTPLQFGALIEGVVEMEVDKCGTCVCSLLGSACNLPAICLRDLTASTAGHEELLFRDNASYSTRFLDLLLQRYGREFFKKVLGSVKVKFKPEQLEARRRADASTFVLAPVRSPNKEIPNERTYLVATLPSPTQVNPAKEPNADKLAQNAKNLIQLASKVLAALFERAHKFPPYVAPSLSLSSSSFLLQPRVRIFECSCPTHRFIVIVIVIIIITIIITIIPKRNLGTGDLSFFPFGDSSFILARARTNSSNLCARTS